MTDLTAKFTALEAQLTTQHNALLADLAVVRQRIDTTNTELSTVNTNLQTIITKLGDINTTLAKNGAFDPAPIVTAIANMRGVGPENTIKSVNQSIWNIAGTAPGRSLSDLYDILTYQDGSILWTTAGAINAVRLALHNADQTLDAGDLLTAINNNIISAMIKPEIMRLLAQFDTSVVYPTMKNLLMTISQQQEELINLAGDPLTVVPADICAEPLVSTGQFFQDATLVMVDPVTYATWPETPGGDFSASYDITMDAYPILHCTDWTAYRIYVASKADTFGVITGRGTRYPCNQWITLDIPEGGIVTGAAFNVARANGLIVYICGIDAPALGDCPSAAQSPLSVSAWHIAHPDLPWYAATLAGGASWTTDASMMIEGTIAQNGFVITAPGDVDMCFAWDVTAEPTVAGLGLHAYYEAFSGQWSQIAVTGAAINPATYGGHASTVITLTDLNTAPYQITDVVFVPYLVFTDNHQFPPDVSFQIAYLPSGWNAS